MEFLSETGKRKVVSKDKGQHEVLKAMRRRNIYFPASFSLGKPKGFRYFFLRFTPRRLSIPVPRRNMVAGSGTGSDLTVIFHSSTSP